MRVEPETVERVLKDHEAVKEVLVEPRGRRLIAYVVPRLEQRTKALEWEKLRQWQQLFDQVMEEPHTPDPEDRSFNTRGWNSSRTGEPLAADEMREWLAHTVARIRALAGRRVLEIGCGVGMLMAPLSSLCQTYVATDFSRVSLNYASSLELENVQLHHRLAHDLNGLPKDFDLVIVNSVVQYFPGLDYLLKVVDAAMEQLGPRGLLFLGDLRHLELCRSHRARGEEELMVSPAFFPALKGRGRIRGCSVWPRRGLANNDMSLFRYDGLLYLDQAPPEVEVPWLDSWQSCLDDGRPLVGLKRMPNGRFDPAAHHPEHWWSRGAELCWAAGYPEGAYDLLLRRPDCNWLPRRSISRTLDSCVNQPLRPRLENELLGELREVLRARFPQSLILIRLLETLPRGEDGKLDRAALPQPFENLFRTR